MNTIYYADATTGAYLGAFEEGLPPPSNSIEVPFPPDDTSQIWLGNVWSESTMPKPDQFITNIITDPDVPAGIFPFLNSLIDPELQVNTWSALTAEPPPWLTGSYRLQLVAWAAQANITLEG